MFIANILKCRPPNNRDPKPEEAAACRGYLERQIELVNQPRIILAVGRIAAQKLLATDEPVGRMRGKRHSFGDVPLVVTYHPAYLLRSPSQKRKSWDDLCLARSRAGAAYMITPMQEPPVAMRAMTHEDLSFVSDIERRSYEFPWSHGVFRDCLLAGYQCIVLDARRQCRGLRRPVDRGR